MTATSYWSLGPEMYSTDAINPIAGLIIPIDYPIFAMYQIETLRQWYAPIEDEE